MKLRKEDQDWLTDEISRIVGQTNADLGGMRQPTRVRRAMHWLREWGAISALWAVPLALLAMVITLGVFASNSISSNGKFQGTTETRLTALEKGLDAIRNQLAEQPLTSRSTLPLEEFKKTLPALTSEIVAAKEQKAAIPTNVIQSIQEKLIATDKNTPGYWAAATQLVNYKFQDQSTSAERLPDCLDLKPKYLGDATSLGNGAFTPLSPPHATPVANIGGEIIDLTNCAIDLDDDGRFYSTTVGKIILAEEAQAPNVKHFILRFSNAHIKSSGGSLLPVYLIQFQHCAIELIPTAGIPNKNSQSITTQLLAATDTSQGSIQLSG